MTDVFDRASTLENEERERVLNSHLNRVKERPDHPGFCNDCGNTIPGARLNANPDAVTCFTCQDIREKRGKRGLGSC
ncbi:TraR/DksA family transcriptional regulator [Edwardsiella piscicida]|uniref:TraR/DksA family transcriptional regulator n=1 Tax=Edwardsiella piscicida TaxID=1263550 RepID=UPI00101AB82F|nr:TraR/DksA family transcriptional regulator [Edwardsiella piscicida]ELM3734815.1 TraR/DksA family transcriptional regulator [Edwardsiella piscicida]QBB14223.1 TraR/DksA family transcriptional regulator [Edwardsiella piscicida]WGS78533.1 TraR/DksA family transcriptional regulator [Edwardsiella piscicida]WGS81918.1 TraR/DksA family transcriptional regulator [Edwardsiella piscicida]